MSLESLSTYLLMSSILQYTFYANFWFEMLDSGTGSPLKGKYSTIESVIMPRWSVKQGCIFLWKIETIPWWSKKNMKLFRWCLHIFLDFLNDLRSLKAIHMTYFKEIFEQVIGYSDFASFFIWNATIAQGQL